MFCRDSFIITYVGSVIDVKCVNSVSNRSKDIISLIIKV